MERIIDTDSEINSNLDSASMKAWIKRYFSHLPKDINSSMLQPLLSVAKNAFSTTFIDDYSINDSGIGLEQLVGFPRKTVDACLNALVHHAGNFYTATYVEQFRERFYGARHHFRVDG